MVKVKFDVQRFSNVIHGTASGDYGSNIADNTQVYGLAGNDTIETNGIKNVILIGGSGNDVIHMTGGSGTLNGGAGSDTFKLTYSGANTLSAVIEDIAPTTDKLIIDYAGTETPKINYSTVGKDIVLTDDNGYFNVTLKGYREANDYFDGTANENVWEVFKIVNQERESHGLNWLILSQGLIDATSIRAEELVESFSHTRPNGTSCFTASEKSYSGMGENIAAGYSSPEDVMVGWMNSTGHRANILNEDYKKIGVGYYYESGSYYGNHWVQMFGGTLDETETVSVANLLGTAVTISANGVTKSTSTLGNISNLKRTTISGTAGADLLVNGRWYGEKATQNVEILGLGGNDTISNSGSNSVLDGGAGNDEIHNGYYYYDNGWTGFLEESYNGDYDDENGSSNVTINGGTGDDEIHNLGENAVYVYNSGDGADTIFGYNSGDTIKIFGAKYSTQTSGSNVIVSVKGSGTIKLVGASDKTLNIVGTLEGSSGVTLSNSTKNTIISGTNYADSIYNSSANVTINSSAGYDVINNVGNNVLINAGAGNDSTWGGGNEITINGGAGNDRLELWGINSVINTDDGNNEVFIHGNNVTVNGGTGKDSVEIWDDYGGYPPKAVGKAKVSTGADNDFVKNYGAGATINTGAGNDTIQIISGYTYNGTRANVYQYAHGDGNDTILGYNSGDSIQITRGSYTTMTSGNDVIISVGSGKILLKDSKNTTLNIDGDAETTLPAGISIKSATLTASTAFTGSKIDLADYATNVTKVNASALSRSVSIVGTAAANSLKGGKGADTIYGGAGNDTVSLGGGADIYIYSGGNDLIQDYVAGTDKIKLASASITGSSLSGKNVILKTSAGNITVKNGKNKKITVIDSRGAETSNVYPLETLPAGLSYDSAKKTLTVGTSYGGAAIDLANFATTTKTVDASAYSKKIQITGNNLGNTIRGGKGNDTLSGGSKADTIYGGAGIDKIYGGAGADKLFGDAENDTLYGGAGNDTLTGGDGKDVFVCGSGEGKDVIADYTAGTDKIKISSGAITATGYKSNDVVFTVGSGNLTVKNGRGKKITIVDAAGRTSTKTYTAGVSYGRNGNAAVPWFTADDANFISGEANLDAISAEKYSVTNFSATNFENIFAQEIQPVYSTDKTK